MTDWRSVGIQSPATQTHYPTAETKKTCKMQAFSRAAEGIRTLDLLHGKQDVCFLVGAQIPCKRRG